MSDTSENESKASEKEQDEQEKDSVFDFLYHDVRRVGSFLAQFDDAGHLQSVTQSDLLTKGGRRGLKLSLGGALPGDLGKAETTFERGPGEAGSETSERAYDPLWANARTLLDYLTEHGMIQRDIWEARIGQFVLARGQLVVLDLGMLKEAWGKASIKQLLQAAEATQRVSSQPNRQARRREAAGSRSQEAPSEVQIMIDMLTILPHSTQAHLIGDNFRVWCSLPTEWLVGSSSDLVLKHGSYVPGEWHMLGILDAFPQASDEADGDELLSGINAAVASVAATPVGTLTANLAPITRKLLGRPDPAFGITPLLVFREVSG